MLLSVSETSHFLLTTQSLTLLPFSDYGYIVSVLPISLLLSRFPLIRSLALCVFVWGIVCILTVVVTNYPGLVVQRVALGLVEVSDSLLHSRPLSLTCWHLSQAAVSPGFVLLTSLWYKKEEQTMRLGIWYGATGVSRMTESASSERSDSLLLFFHLQLFSMVSGVINYGLGSAKGSLHPWKYM